MARIRSIHPGIWTDEAFVSVSRDARLLFIGILNECDDQGVFAWKPLQLTMRLFPVQEVTRADVSGWMDELASANLVCQFEASGASYGAVRNFRRWQKPEKPRMAYPLPENLREYVHLSPTPRGKVADASVEPPPTSRRLVADTSTTEKEREREREKEEEERKKAPLPSVEGASAPRNEEPKDPKALLWKDGLSTVKVLTGLEKGPASKLLGRWVNLIEGDHTALHAILRRAETEQPDNPAAWVMGAIQARARETAPLFAATVTPIDPYGLRAWIARQPDVVTEHSSHTGRDEPTINGYLIGMSAELFAEAAGLPESWRGSWDALGTWMREDIAMIDPVLAAVRDQAARMGGGIGSAAVFDAAVRRAARRVA
jgi:hypothetical protein